jgi:hypothetical protein
MMVANAEFLRTSLFTALTDGYSNRDIKDTVEGQFHDLLLC